jgi:uncharacterized protein (DUF849 family)
MVELKSSPLVVCVAPNGARRTREDHPALPVTVDEIASDAADCAAAGASTIHLHVRDAEGRHSLDPAIYADAIRAVRREAGTDLLIQVTTEAVGIYGPDAQMATVRALRPEAASLALRELAPDEAGLSAFAGFVEWALAAGIGLQYILYAPDEVVRFRSLVQRGVVAEDRPHALFVLGRYTAGQQSSPRDLRAFRQAWPADWPWSVCAFGRQERDCLLEAASKGGHVRVGFENNLLNASGEPAACNAEQVAAVVAAASRPLASAAETRSIFNAGLRVGAAG